MYAFIEGNYVLITPMSVQMNVHGVGYELLITLRTFEQIKNQKSGKLYTHLHVREDQMVLFGFFDEQEKESFKLLIQVSGIGASTARMILSGVSPEELKTIIVHKDTKQLERVKGIGKKTAERLILELKDKIGTLEGLSSATSTVANVGNQQVQDALMALVSLGINKYAAEQAVKKVLETETENITIENLIKKSLASL